VCRTRQTTRFTEKPETRFHLNSTSIPLLLYWQWQLAGFLPDPVLEKRSRQMTV
jgi:hypothetical protein